MITLLFHLVSEQIYSCPSLAATDDHCVRFDRRNPRFDSERE